MSLALHNLKASVGARRSKKRVGRGNASGHGTTATRGTKGQRARQGGRRGLIQLGAKHFVSRLPKVRGFQSFKTRPQVVYLSALEKMNAGAQVTPESLFKLGLITSLKLPVKIISTARKLPQLIIKVHAVSGGARTVIEAAGGRIEILPALSRKPKK